MRIVHLPVFRSNPYQYLLMQAQRDLGHVVMDGHHHQGGPFLFEVWRRWKPQALHFHWLHPFMLDGERRFSLARTGRFLAEVALAKRAGWRIVWTIHNLVSHGGKFTLMEQAFTRPFGHLADACMAHSKAASEEAQRTFRIPAHKMHVVPHGNYIGCYPNTIDRGQARARLGLPEGAFVYLFFGRILPYKGVFELVEAFAQLPLQCRLVIAGNARDAVTTERLQTAARQDSRIVVFPNHIPDEEIQVYFRTADIAVFPYQRILTSGSLILAQSFGTPVVAPEMGGCPEGVGTDSGWLFDPAQKDSLATTLKIALNDPELAAKAAASRKRAEAWPWAKVAREMNVLYGVPV